MNADVSIIIVNYKTSSLVDACLKSIQEKSNGFSYEVIIVDNSNNRDEYEKLLALQDKYSFCQIVDAKGNIGFGCANNLGCNKASGHYYLFLNSDTLLVNNAIKAMLDIFQQNKDAGAVGCNLFTKEMKPTHSYMEKEQNLHGVTLTNSFFVALARKSIHSDQFNQSSKVKELDGYITGACLMVKKEAFERVGGFDKEIFMYGEDNLLCTLIKRSGYKLFNTPRGQIIHLEGGSDTPLFSDFKINNIVHGIYIFALRAYGESEAKKYIKKYIEIWHHSFQRNELFHHSQKAVNAKKLQIAFNELYQKLK